MAVRLLYTEDCVIFATGIVKQVLILRYFVGTANHVSLPLHNPVAKKMQSSVTQFIFYMMYHSEMPCIQVYI